MAGPSIVVRVLGDLSGLSKSFSDVQSKGAAAASGMHTAFSGMLSTLNQTGVLGPFGSALDGIDQALDKVSGKAKNLGPSMLGAGAALAGVGVGLSALGSADQAASQQLQAAIAATGHSYDDYKDQVEGAVKSQEKFGHTANQTQDALRILTEATHDPAKALQLLSEASDLAAAKHEDLGSAATALGKVYNGNTKLLKEFGIQVTNTKTLTTAATSATKAAQSADDNLARAKRSLADIEAVDSQRKTLTIGQQIQLRNAQEAVTTATQKAAEAHQKAAGATQALNAATVNAKSGVSQLADAVKGQANAAASTFTGHLEAIKAHLEDMAAKFGQKYGPAVTAFGTGLTAMGAVVTTTQGILGAFKKSTDDVKAANDAAKASIEATTAATEAQGAAADATQLSFEGMTGAEVATEAAGLPLLATVGLIVVAVAALGAVAYVIYRNWSTIWGAMKDAAKAVWDWIRTNWPLLLAILTGPIGLAVLEIVRHWHDIIAGLQVVWNWIKGVWNDVYNDIIAPIVRAGEAVINFFVALPGRLANLGRGMFNFIADAFIDAINFIIRIWNDLHFKAPGFSVFGHHIGGFDIGLPHIPNVPYLAQGGLITASGLVFAHAGEAITPIDKAPRGPALVINEAHFNDAVDVELLMRKTAWAVQTQRI